jgi:hypothetical protein
LTLALFTTPTSAAEIVATQERCIREFLVSALSTATFVATDNPLAHKS